ncbi:MAG: hypothetical protein HN712_12215 [Gemmatimonadetes bacterium]|jgi:hypothetical protein|nr:hypothetical protein [Gemmatimonadota bacterium]MBT6150081.1 hypothetical protein [Gemmatimonadota bacterium]MBT7861075.1 hypothetical protein [Gemmatimonadota bacterium]
MTESTGDKIRYCYEFQVQGVRRRFELQLDRQTLALEHEPIPQYPDWTALSSQQCPNCPLTPEEHPRCPIAANITGLVEFFADIVSYDEVEVRISTDERSYSKRTITSEAVSSLLGIYMVTSGCPIMDKLRPLVRFHLPVATVEETRFRAIAMYLVAQFFVHRKGGVPDWDLEKLPAIYREIGMVNRSFMERLRQTVAQDANLNAVVRLDCFASTIILTIDTDELDEMEATFLPYLTPE